MINYLLLCLLIVIMIKLIYDYIFNINENFDIKNIEYTDNEGNKMNFNEEELNNLDNTVPELCRSILKEEEIKLGLGDDIDSEIQLDLILKNYKLKIKSGEIFHEKLDKLEIDVFKQYYGIDSWESNYNTYLENRKKEQDKITNSKCKNYYDNYLFSSIEENDEIFSKETIKKSINILSYFEENLKSKKNENIRQNNEDIIQENEINNDELYIRKIQYREKEQNRLHFFNKLINIIYYILFISILLVLYTSNKLFIYSNFHIYLFLFLLPILIYPFIYNIIIKIRDQLDKNVSSIFLRNAYN